MTGGIIPKNNKKYDNNFYQIKINVNFDEFSFEFKELKGMINERASHTMILYKDYFIVVGGVNTKTCEVYDFSSNTWTNLSELPSRANNPALCIVNDFLFCLSGSGDILSFDGIYKLSLKNIQKIINSKKGFEDFLSWERVDYAFGQKGRIRRGMGALNLNNKSILLLGGFDFDNIYDNIYDFNLISKKDQKNEILNKSSSTNNTNPSNNNLEKNNIEKEEMLVDEEDGNILKILDTDITLPIKTYFNSNLILLDYILIMIDGFNNALEFNLKTQEFFYYT